MTELHEEGRKTDPGAPLLEAAIKGAPEGSPERMRAELARARLLSDAAEALGTPIGVEGTAERLAHLLVDHISDWCAIALLEEGELRDIVVLHRDPERVALAQRLREEYPPDPDTPRGAQQVVRTGKSELYPEITEELLRESAVDDAHLELIRSAGMTSALVVPLVARGDTIGALTLVSDRPDVHYQQEDVEFAERLARIAAHSIENSRLLELAREQRDFHQTFLTALDTGNQGYALIEGDRFVYVSDASAQIIGRNWQELLGISMFDLIVPEDRERARAVLDSIAAGERQDEPLTVTVMHADGSRIDVEYTIQLLEPGPPPRFVRLSRDVTAQRAQQLELQEQRDLYETVLRAQGDLGEGVVILEGERIVYANDAAAALSGRGVEELLAMGSVLDLIEKEARPGVAERLRAALEEGRPEPGYETRLQRPDGSIVDLEVAAQVIVRGDSVRVVAIGRDITPRKTAERARALALAAERAAREEVEAARDRAMLLSDAGRILESSLQPEVTLAQLAELLAGRLADACTIELLAPDGRLRRVGASAGDGDQSERMRAADVDLRIEQSHPIPNTMRSGEPLVLDGLGESDWMELATNDEHLAILRQVRPRSGLVLPVRRGDKPIAAISLWWLESARRLDDDTAAVVDDLVGRVALVVENANLYRDREHVARQLQDGLLPPVLPHLPGFTVAARYVPGLAGMEVGGDFYDVFESAPDVWSIVVGDVCGKGAEAAAMTALARHSLRTLADGRTDPADLLGRLNRAILRERDDMRFVTAALGRLVLVGERPRLDMTCAGHPPALLLRRDGECTGIGARGPLLGVRPHCVYTTEGIDLMPGDAVVLYTDGLIERRNGTAATTEELCATGVEVMSRGPQAVADALIESVLSADEAADDDVAVLVLGVER